MKKEGILHMLPFSIFVFVLSSNFYQKRKEKIVYQDAFQIRTPSVLNCNDVF